MLHIFIKNGGRQTIFTTISTTTSVKSGVTKLCLLSHYYHHQYRDYSRSSLDRRCHSKKASISASATVAAVTTNQPEKGCTFNSSFSSPLRRTEYGCKYTHSYGHSYGSRRNLLTLAIETSCDDTCVAILEKRSILDDIDSGDRDPNTNGGEDGKATSTEIPKTHAKLHFHEKITAKNTGLGGIHPLEALQSHRENLAKLISKSLNSLPVVKSGFASPSPSPSTSPSPSSPISASISTTSSTTFILGEVDPIRTITGPDGLTRQKPDFITVTRGPGMRSNLACGLDTAKGLSVAWGIPLLGVHHMQAHALTPRLVYALNENGTNKKEKRDENETENERDMEGNKLREVTDLKPTFPFLTLLVSGGHTMLLHSTRLNTHKILATTADIAIGDALDKIGRLLLPDDLKAKVTKDTAYAKHLSEYAFPTPDHFKHWNIPKRRADEIDRPVNEYGWQIHAPLAQTRDLSFSFSSTATRPEKIFKDAVEAGTMSSDERLLLARTALGTAFEHLSSRVIIALETLRDDGISIPTLVVSGGVAANDFLRYILRSILDVRGFGDVGLIFPPVALCTDNAAMIAWTGLEMYEAGFRSDLDICSIRKWSMDAESEDGGILGVGGWIQVDA